MNYFDFKCVYGIKQMVECSTQGVYYNNSYVESKIPWKFSEHNVGILCSIHVYTFIRQLNWERRTGMHKCFVNNSFVFELDFA